MISVFRKVLQRFSVVFCHSFMKFPFFITLLIFFVTTSCTKSKIQPKSKTDYIPIISANSPDTVNYGQSITAVVTCGFYDHFADITFLNFEVKENAPKQFEIRAKAFYDNIQDGISLPVVSIFDTSLIINTTTSGQYFLKFYSFNQLVQTDTIRVN